MKCYLSAALWCTILVATFTNASRFETPHTTPPYHADLFGMNDESCSGAIIHKRFILTSALCALTIKPIKAVIGYKSESIDLNIKIIHSSYEEFWRNDTIALIVTSKDMERVTPIDLNDQPILNRQISLTAISWHSDAVSIFRIFIIAKNSDNRNISI